MENAQILIFVVASLAVILSPGQDMVLVLSRGMIQGARAGMAVATGVSVGLLGHTVLATIGLGALLQSSQIAFTVMKIVGAIYLLYLGIKAFTAPSLTIEAAKANQLPLSKLFMQGAVSNISNPKVAIFYFAYLPQFISADATNQTGLLFLLGAGFALLTLLVKLPIGYLASRLSRWMLSRPAAQRMLNRASGIALIGLGLKLATEKAPTTS